MARVIATVLCAVVLSTPDLARAQPRGPVIPLAQWREELQLTEDQVRSIDAIHYSSRIEEIAKQADIARSELELDRVLRGDTVDEAAAMRLFEDLHKARGELEKLHLRTRIKIRATLTPEQRRRLDELVRERGPRHRLPPRAAKRPKVPDPR